MSIIIKSGTSGNLAAVNSAGELATTATMTGNDGTTARTIRTGTGGEIAVALTNPDGAGIFAGVSPFGALNVSVDPTLIFSEHGDAALDATGKWNVLGTVVPTVGTSNVLVNPTNAASATSVLSSMPTFSTSTSVTVGAKIALEAGALATGSHRFFGLGTSPGTPGTSAAPLQDAIGFEIDTAGVLRASSYSNGTRVFTQILTAPADGNQHLYAVLTRADVSYFYIDSFAEPLASTYLGPAVQNLPLRVASLNSAAVTGTPQLTAAGMVIYDAARQATQLADGVSPWRRASIGRSGGLSVKGAAFTPISTAFAATITGATASVDVSEAGSVTYIIKNTVAATAYTGAPVIQLEQSDDGVSWAQLIGVRSDTSTAAATVTPTGVASTSVAVDCSVEGVNYVRARLTTGTATGGLTIVVQPGGLASVPSTALISPVRTNIVISGTTLSVGTSGTETALTLGRSAGIAAPSSAASFTVPAGKRFRMTSLVLGQVGNLSLATSAATTFRFRVNAAGAVTTSSNVIMQARVGTIAQTGNYSTVTLPIPDGWEMTGDGVAQFGVTVNSNYAVNAPTVDVMITGYEY